MGHGIARLGQHGADPEPDARRASCDHRHPVHAHLILPTCSCEAGRRPAFSAGFSGSRRSSPSSALGNGNLAGETCARRSVAPRTPASPAPPRWAARSARARSRRRRRGRWRRRRPPPQSAAIPCTPFLTAATITVWPGPGFDDVGLPVRLGVGDLRHLRPAPRPAAASGPVEVQVQRGQTPQQIVRHVIEAALALRPMLSFVQADVRGAVEQPLQRHPALGPRQGRADAAVGAASEGDMVAHVLAVEAQFGRIGELWPGRGSSRRSSA